MKSKHDSTTTKAAADIAATQRPVIYQMLPRIFGNRCTDRTPNGTLEQNGAGKLNDITPEVLQSIAQLGATHVWYTGIIEHATATDYSEYGIRPDNPYVVKGKAGSPYAVKDWYDIDPDVAVDVSARMAEFEALVQRTHEAGLKVITDFVPNHVARQYHSDNAPIGVEDFGVGDNTDVFFSAYNNFYYIPRQRFAPNIPLGAGRNEYIEFPARCTGNDCFTAFPSVNDWYETVKLNYGYDPGDGSRHYDPIPRTWMMMLSVLRFWAAKGVDAFRCDMAHMVPVEFWHWAIAEVKRDYPAVQFIAEIYDVGLYRTFIDYGGFDYLYDKVTLYDTLRGIDCHGTSAAMLTSCWQTVEGIGDKMLTFLENHDEQRYASPQYTGCASKFMPAMAVTCAMGRGAVMVYMGQELGEDAPDAEGFSGLDGRTTIFDYWSLPRLQRWLYGTPTGAEQNLRNRYARLLSVVNGNEAIRRGAFFDVMYVNYHNPGFDPHRHYAFLRATANEVVLVAVNFGDTPAAVAVNVPAHAFDTLQLPMTGLTGATELLSGVVDKELALAPEAATTVQLGAHGAAMWRWQINPAATGKQKKSTKKKK